MNLIALNNMQNSKYIGEKIARLRKEYNLSQAQLAQKISISPQAVGKWERGESLPDITTLQRLAIIFEVDLNHFSESFEPSEKAEAQTVKLTKSAEYGWDMSSASWHDADFSGINKLTDKFNECNIKNCKFIDSGLSNLKLKSNKIVSCDFTNAIVKNSKVQTSTIAKSIFVDCSLENAELKKSILANCDLTKANLKEASFSDATFQGNIVKLAIWNKTSFKNTGISNIIFDGTIAGCFFENCSFEKVKFENAIIKNTFFKHNQKLNQVHFENCQVDKITYSFLKNDGANLEGIKLVD